MAKGIELTSFWVLWMLFVCSLSSAEALVGIAAAFLAVLGLEALKRAYALRFRRPIRLSTQLRRIPAAIGARG